MSNERWQCPECNDPYCEGDCITEEDQIEEVNTSFDAKALDSIDEYDLITRFGI